MYRYIDTYIYTYIHEVAVSENSLHKLILCSLPSRRYADRPEVEAWHVYICMYS